MRLLKLLSIIGAALLAMPAQAADFTYSGTVAIPSASHIWQASVYPITFEVSGLTTIDDVNITLSGLTHNGADDLVMALRSPGGTTILFLDNAGGTANWVNATVTFDQDAASKINNTAILYGGTNGTIPQGTYLPSVYGLGGNLLGFVLDGSDLSTFNGEDANGTWKLYIGDNGFLGTGQLTGATLSIMSAPVPEPASWAMMIAGMGLIGATLRTRKTVALAA